MMPLRAIKARLREGRWAWPGGYPVAFLAENGDVLSWEAVRWSWRAVVRAHVRKARWDDWAIASEFIHWEGPDLVCSATGVVIPAAYGDPDED
jgi:hypothetical protein